MSFLCGGCDFRLAEPIHLDSVQLPGITAQTQFTIDASATALRLAYGPTEVPGKVVVYDHGTGRHQNFGRFGEGPGEFGDVIGVAFAGRDSLVVLQQAAYSVLSLRDGSATRYPLPPGVRALSVAVDDSRRVMFANHGVTQKRIVVAALGASEVTAFGGRVLGPGGSFEAVQPTFYLIAAGPGGSVLAAPRSYQWAPQQWTVGGDSLPFTVPAPGWYVPYTYAEEQAAIKAGNYPRLAEFTELTGLAVLEAKYVALLGKAPETNPFTQRDSAGFAPVDARLELLDLSSGRTLASATIDEFYQTLLPGGWLARFTSDTLGFRSIQLRRILFAVSR